MSGLGLSAYTRDRTRKVKTVLGSQMHEMRANINHCERKLVS